MNLAETTDLLTLIAAIDNRKFGEETVIAWQELLADVAFADAREAVLRHRGTSDAYLMPVHVIAGARAARLDRVDAAPNCPACGNSVLGAYHLRWCSGLPAIEAAPADPERVQALLSELREKLGSRT